jgi:hypothetical protein
MMQPSQGKDFGTLYGFYIGVKMQICEYVGNLRTGILDMNFGFTYMKSSSHFDTMKSNMIRSGKFFGPEKYLWISKFENFISQKVKRETPWDLTSTIRQPIVFSTNMTHA